MQVELNAAELKEILRCMDECESRYFELEDRIILSISEAEELESLDLNDCGDACKL